MTEIKLYKVTFNEYATNSYDKHTQISTAHHNLDGDYVDEKGRNISMNLGSKDYKYLSIPGSFIIKESEIEHYKKFGNGIKELIYVGSMLEE